MPNDKREKVYYALAYLVTTILTLLPFFLVGVSNVDDFLYFNIAHTDLNNWRNDAVLYAHGQGRFYYLITKYFYYIPYLFNSFAWTKFVQYSSLCICYLLFSYIVYRIFKSRKLGALSLLFLVFNTSIGYYIGYVLPIGYPFYFTFSFILFLCGVLLFINYTEKGNSWRLVFSALLFFASSLFYEDYLAFTLLFICFILIRNWKRLGFSIFWKNKSFYLELIPYVAVLFLYMVCYFGYRFYLLHVLGLTPQYSGAQMTTNFNWRNFFLVLNNWSFYNVPGRICSFGKAQSLMVENSLLPGGHVGSIWFMLTHSTAVAYLNALIQCLILWFLIKRHDFDRIPWRVVAVGIFAALVFALSANVLVAITEKYNADWAINMKAYVTSFFSYFGVMLVIVLLVAVTLKLSKTPVARKSLCVCWCVVFFCFSVINYYVNDHMSRVWKKSENRITMLKLVGDKGFFDSLPDGALIYTEQLQQTSEHGRQICDLVPNFEMYISSLVDNPEKLVFAKDQEELQSKIKESPDVPVYFMQATESKKFCELMMCFSHISCFDTADISLSKADKSDIFYYSPTKEYVLFYGTNAHTDSANVKSVSVISNDKHQKVVQATLKEEGLDPFGFSISNMCVPTRDTLWVPVESR